MKLYALDKLNLCDGCGELYTYNVETSITCLKTERNFCSLTCYNGFREHGRIVVFRCWACAKELSAPVPAWELRWSGHMATFCGLGCQAEFKGAAKKEGWISTKGRLPKEGEWVLGFDGRWHQVVCLRLGTNTLEARWGLVNFGEMFFESITHWQPLPEAPPEPEQKREIGFCRDCGHWYGDEVDTGICSALNEQIRIQVQSTRGYSRVDRRRTAHDWGCIQFQPKEDE
jgi:hypothetical protein